MNWYILCYFRNEIFWWAICIGKINHCKYLHSQKVFTVSQFPLHFWISATAPSAMEIFFTVVSLHCTLTGNICSVSSFTYVVSSLMMTPSSCCTACPNLISLPEPPVLKRCSWIILAMLWSPLKGTTLCGAAQALAINRAYIRFRYLVVVLFHRLKLYNSIQTNFHTNW